MQAVTINELIDIATSMTGEETYQLHTQRPPYHHIVNASILSTCQYSTHATNVYESEEGLEDGYGFWQMALE